MHDTQDIPFSMSTSSNTIMGLLPPSSNETGWTKKERRERERENKDPYIKRYEIRINKSPINTQGENAAEHSKQPTQDNLND